MRVYLIRELYLNKLNTLIPYCIFTINDTYLYFDKILIKIKTTKQKSSFYISKPPIYSSNSLTHTQA